MTKIEYGISWDALNTGKWKVFEMHGTNTVTLFTFETRAEANAAMLELNKTPIKLRVAAA